MRVRVSVTFMNACVNMQRWYRCSLYYPVNTENVVFLISLVQGKCECLLKRIKFLFSLFSRGCLSNITYFI